MISEQILKKMNTELANPVQYSLNSLENKIILNQYIGHEIGFKFNHEIFCLSCGSKTYKSFAQGYCYSCFVSSPDTEECILKPELCRAHEGIARDMKVASERCLQNHYVYLAVSSEVKVGVTRSTQIPTRWIDQGASYAVPFALVPNRFLAGCIEVFLKKYYTDKTSWQKMLKNEISKDFDLISEKKRAFDLLPDEYKIYYSTNDEIIDIQYPVIKYPSKIKSLSLDTQFSYYGILSGIKGQYLIFDDGTVFNVRRHSGYKVTWQF